MAKSRITGRRGFLGRVYYYDERGRYVGKSCPGLIEGTRVFSDENGRYAGTSRPGFFGSSHTVLEREEMPEKVWEEWETEGEEAQAAPPRSPVQSALAFALCLGIFGLITGIYALIHMF